MQHGTNHNDFWKYIIFGRTNSNQKLCVGVEAAGFG